MTNLHLTTFPNVSSTSFSFIASTPADRLVSISASDLFACITRTDKIQISRFASRINFSRGDRLLEEGTPAHHVFLIESGCVKLTQTRPSGGEVILWLRGAGDSMGLLGTSSKAPNSCSATAVVAGTALVMDWSSLNSMNAAFQISSNVNRILALRVAELQERFCEIAAENVSLRVASALARALEQVGVPSTEGVEIHLTRHELAQLTGTTLFSVSRLIAKWETKGLVESSRRAILVRQPRTLVEMVRESIEMDEAG
jgi:CRP-like cAMP-binding protein